MAWIAHISLALAMLTLAARTAAVPTEVCTEVDNRTTMFDEITHNSSMCFIACSELCQPFSKLVAEYLRNSSSDNLTRVLCAAKFRFQCLYEKTVQCNSLVRRASLLFDVPPSLGELNVKCAKFVGNTTTNTTTTSKAAGDETRTTTTTTSSEPTTSLAHDVPPGTGTISTTTAPTSSALGLSGSRVWSLALAFPAVVLASSA
eukprot:CAMPEP_0203994602 /NCGR_PEP_ID=MMETSP0360-20130528/11513_1 /ASSEMBLY_ACC=CAM_ASM_000342 /TAXON_ID=268821 /ORGANISM="Scrippsiella Hangoei, Strain SHTV-5" /LENGTH=202 /DNA_ID=CAMNT_0050935199 /DNA_START=40 /DNA_END=648 /DNA_ORIENTATION=+